MLAHCNEPFGNEAFASGIGSQEAFLVTTSALLLAVCSAHLRHSECYCLANDLWHGIFFDDRPVFVDQADFLDSAGRKYLTPSG